MPVYFYNPATFSPDRGELPANPGLVEALNLVPTGQSQWIIDGRFTERLSLTTSDVRGVGLQPSNGSAWFAYYGDQTRLFQINPSGWTETNRSGSTYAADSVTGWQFTAYGPHMVASHGHNGEVQIQLDGVGNFENMITNSEPLAGGAGPVTGNWPPQAKFVASWGPHVAIANLTDVGPANAFGNTCGFLWWISAAENARKFSSISDDPGDRTTFDYIADEHGDITGLAGGREFGAVFKATATYRVTYGGPLLVDVELVSQNIGTIWPNGGVWADDEYYFMSTAGPAVLTRNGIGLIGVSEVQRTLFDESWIVDSYTLNTDQSALLYLYAAYHPTLEMVSWYYRSTADIPERVIHYHRRSGRFSVGSRDDFAGSDNARFSARVYGTLTVPDVEATRFSGAQGLLMFSVDPGGNGMLYEASPTGTYYWKENPKLTSPWLVLSRDPQGRPMRSDVVAVRPYYSLNAGSIAAPQINVTIEAKQKPGTVSASTASTMTEDSDGKYHLSSPVEGMFHRLILEYGDDNMKNMSDLADIFQGAEIEYEMGDTP